MLRQRHGAVLGLISLARSYPFTVPEWMPGLIETLAKFATEPAPISNSIRSFGAEFQQNHQVSDINTAFVYFRWWLWWLWWCVA
jgi:proteasome activator subunit 4